MLDTPLALLAAVALAFSPEAAGEPEAAGGSESEPGWSYLIAVDNREELSTSDTRITVLPSRLMPEAGYGPLSIAVDNSLGPSGDLRLVFTGSSGARYRVERTLHLAAGERTTVALPVPSSAYVGRLRADGPGLRAPAEGFVSLSNRQQGSPSVLVLGEASSFEWLVGQRPATDWSRGQIHVSLVPPREAPEDLAAYVGYDAVVVVDREAAKLVGEAQRRAIEAYVLTGGHLVLAPGTGLEASLVEEGPSPRTTSASTRLGLGTVHRAGPKSIPSALRAERPLLVAPREPPERRGGRWRTDDGWALLQEADPPVGAFALVMIAFTVAIGPGSYLVARRRGVAMPLVTIPLTALVACGAIVATAVLRDGLGTHAVIYGYTLLDAERHRAITAGVTAFYANLPPKEARFDRFTVPIAPPRATELEWNVDWTDGLRLGAGFLPSRTYREWGVLAVQPTRARLTVRRDGERVLVQNSLGARVAQLWLRLGLELLQCEAVPDGGERPLARAARLSSSGAAPPPAWLARRLMPAKAEPLFPAPLAERFRAPLEDGEFVATLTGAGFVPTGGLALELREGFHAVRGRVSP